jgi:predicted RNase H-like nuclease (RuvC/YqgF family)
VILAALIQAAAETPDVLQIVASSSVAAALVTGLVLIVQTLVTKKLRSPADENERTKLGNEFLRSLLEDARKEREELRMTISELKQTGETKDETIARLETLAESKDDRIHELEARIENMARKLQAGAVITLHDVFGKDAPHIQINLETP